MAPIDELNLNYISHLQQKYPNSEIGYSGHEFGLVTTTHQLAWNNMGRKDRITMDRVMWGSDACGISRTNRCLEVG